MKGTEQVPGIIPMAVNQLFADLKSSGVTFQLSISYLEIYNENVNDLLSEKVESLEVRESISGVYI